MNAYLSNCIVNLFPGDVMIRVLKFLVGDVCMDKAIADSVCVYVYVTMYVCMAYARACVRLCVCACVCVWVCTVLISERYTLDKHVTTENVTVIRVPELTFSDCEPIIRNLQTYYI